jgi:hypothetical protein
MDSNEEKKKKKKMKTAIDLNEEEEEEEDSSTYNETYSVANFGACPSAGGAGCCFACSC